MGARATAAALLMLAAGAAGCGGQPDGARAAPPAGETCPGEAAAVPDPERLLVGTHAGLRFFDAAKQRRLARIACESGARIAREDVSWALVQPRRGAFRWSRTDRMFLVAAQQGLTIHPILDGTPRWAGRDEDAMPYRVADYARFVASAVRRYGPGGSLWREHPALARWAPRFFELYNEPYYQDVDPRRYATTVRAAVRRARPANPAARFLIAADTPNGAGRPWLSPMYAQVPDLGRYFDAVAVHPYSVGYDPGVYDRGSPLRGRQTGRIVEIRDELARRGDGEKKLWITEVGWPTCPRRVSERCVTESTQRRRIAQVMELARTRWRGFVDAIFVFGQQDGPRTLVAAEPFYGLLRRDGTPKPAWTAFRSARR